MAAKTELNFGQMVRDFRNLALTGSDNIRERCDSIVTILLSLLGNSGNGATPPPPPMDLEAGGLQNSVALTWEASEGAVSYKVFRADSAAGPYAQVADINALSLLDLGLEDETTYYYYVKAVALNLAESERSNIADATTEVDDAISDPTTPTNFEEGEITFASVELVWDALAAGTVGIEIQRRRPAAAVPTWVTIVPSAIGTSYLDNRVHERTSYEYRARGLNEVGTTSDWTTTVEVDVPGEDVTPPSVPENLALTAGYGNVVAVADASPELDTRGYIFGVSAVTSGPYTEQAEALTPQVRIPSLADETEYFVVVKAIDTNDNESAWSAEESITTLPAAVGDTTPPPRVTNLVSGSLEPGEITLAWDPVEATDLAAYLVEVSAPPAGTPTGPWVLVRTVVAGTNTTTFTGLDENLTYHYHVISQDTTGNSAEASLPTSRKADGSNGPTGVNVILPPGSGVATQVPDIIGEPGGISTPGGETGAGEGNDPITGITAQGKTGSTVFGFFDSTVAANKEAFLPSFRANRDARGSTSMSVTNQHQTVPSISDTKFTANNYASWAYNTGKSNANNLTAPQRRADEQLFVIDNCEFFGYEQNPPNANGWVQGGNWANQTYDQPGHLTRDTDFESPASGPVDYFDPSFGIPPFTAAQREQRYCYRTEHDQYVHSANSVVWQRCTSRFIGGHSFYIANRPYAYDQYKPDNVAALKPALALIDNCHLIDSSFGSRKGSNKVEIFDFGSPTFPATVIIRNSTLIDEYDWWVAPVGGNETHEALELGPRPGWGRGRGLIGISGYQYCENPQVANATGIANGYDAFNSPGGFGAGIAPMALCLVKNCVLQSTYNIHPFCSFGGVKDVVFEDCVITADGDTVEPMVFNEQGYLSSDPTGTIQSGKRGVPRCETVTFSNCKLRGINLLFKRTGGSDLPVTPQQDLTDLTVTYNCKTGAITNAGGTPDAYDPATDYTDIATIINTIDPFADAGGTDLTGIPGDFDWGIDGVTV